MLKQTDVVRHAVGALREGGEDVQDAAVGLARVGLAADGEAAVKAELCGDAAVHLVDLRAVAVKEVHEAGLGAGRAAAAEEFQRGENVVELLKIAEKILHPESRALADSHGLRRLIVRVAEGRHGGVFARERGEICQHAEQLAAQIAQAVAVENEIGVVGDVAARRAEVDNAGGGRRGLAIGVDVRHHIVAHLALALLGHSVVNVGDVRFQLRDLPGGDGQSQLVLRAGERGPQTTPRLKAHIGGEQVQHIRRRVARRQGRFVNVFAHGSFLFF